MGAYWHTNQEEPDYYAQFKTATGEYKDTYIEFILSNGEYQWDLLTRGRKTHFGNHIH
jgi:hypothetical protein